MPQQKQKKPKRDRRKIFMAAMAGLMVLLMLLPMLTIILQTAGAAPSTSEIKGSISSLQGSAADIAARIKKINQELNEVANDKSKALDQKRLLDQQAAAKEEEIENTQSQIEKFETLIAEQQVVLDDTKAKEEAQFALFCERVRYMEEKGNVTYLSVLFSSDSFADMLDRSTFVSEVMEYDNAVMDELAATRKQIEDIMAELDDSRAQQEAQKANLERQKKDLDVQVKKAQNLVAQIQSQEADYKAAQEELKKEEAQVEAQIKKKQKELAAAMAAGTVSFDPGSGWVWPVAGCYTITSMYGGRIHPITKKPSNHTGTDIAAPKNTPIKSAKGGVVTISTYNNSYGNYVVVDHGGGVATLYAHMTSRAVSEGQVVSQGQVIGYVGTTGSSTGYHLHYELRVNGGRADVLTKYQGISGQFTYR